MAERRKLSRRTFLLSGAALGGGLIVGFAVWPDGPWRPAMNAAEGEHILNAWLTIDTDGITTVYVPFSEMGQGVYTSIPMVVADELGADWDKIRVEHAPADNAHTTPEVIFAFVNIRDNVPDLLFGGVEWLAEKAAHIVGLQITGGSSSTRGSWNTMRTAGAAAREMLIAAAADRWQVDPARLIAGDHRVIDPESGREAGFGDLTEAASLLPPPDDPVFRDAADYRYIGRPMPRIDTPAKVNGSAEYGIDVRIPGLHYAAIRQSPVFGGTVASYDRATALAMSGVQSVVNLGNAVAVVADQYWRASKALAAMSIVFEEGENATLSSDDIFTSYDRALESGNGDSSDERGNVAAALEGAAQTVRATYRVPFLAHTTMEPMNATADIREDSGEIWAPTQAPILSLRAAAGAVGLDDDDVTFHTTFLGGGFGRRSETDFVVQAAIISKEAGVPVQLIWSREEDVQHDFYRPAISSRFVGGLDSDGNLVAWHNRVIGTVEGASALSYDIPNLLVESLEGEQPVPTGNWRSVGHSQNGFFTEVFMDEMARSAGADPVEFRRRLLRRSPRHLRVLNTVAEQSGWGTPPPDGRARGFAFHESFGSIVAEVAQVSLDDSGKIRVHRVTCAVDCGLVINPDTVVAQMESGIIYGLTAALHGEINIERGRVVQTNFPDYPALTLAEAPEIDVHIVESGEALGGIGEPGTPPVAPAVVNAVYELTGQRVRDLPLKNHRLSRRSDAVAMGRG